MPKPGLNKVQFLLWLCHVCCSILFWKCSCVGRDLGYSWLRKFYSLLLYEGQNIIIPWLGYSASAPGWQAEECHGKVPALAVGESLMTAICPSSQLQGRILWVHRQIQFSLPHPSATTIKGGKGRTYRQNATYFSVSFICTTRTLLLCLSYVQ